MKFMTKLSIKIKGHKLLFGFLFLFLLAFAGWALYAYFNKVMPQSAIYFLNDIHTPKVDDKILVFSPHPDDETIALGGYIYDATQAGAKVKIVLVTDGNKQGLKKQRYAEFKKATAKLGVEPSDLIFLGHPDGSLNSVKESVLEKEFRAQIANFEPNIIFYPHADDQHPDHAYTSRVAKKVTKGVDHLNYQYLIHANYFPQPQTYHPDDYLLPPQKLVTFDHEWQRYMVSFETVVKTKEAVEEYKTQMKNPLIRELSYSMIRKNELFTVDNLEED